MSGRPNYVLLARAKNGEFFFVERAGNNKVVSNSETYKRRAGAIRAARRAHPGLEIRERGPGRTGLVEVTE